MPASTVTSSAVVGSSRIRSDGRDISAMAMTMRCCWPPESWCGKLSRMRAGSGRRTASTTRSAWARASAALAPSWIIGTSMSWRPTFIAGLRLAIGSW